MLRVFNTRALNQKQRFMRAILTGVPTALVLGIAYGFIIRIIPIQFSIVYLGIGWLIGYVIRINGRGVQKRFSVFAAILAVFSFILSDVVRYTGLYFIFYPQYFILIPLNYLQNINGMIHILFLIGGAYFAYEQARII